VNKSDVQVGQIWMRKNGNLVLVSSIGLFRGEKSAYLKPVKGPGRTTNKLCRRLVVELEIVGYVIAKNTWFCFQTMEVFDIGS